MKPMDKAAEVQKRAHAPYSNFKVGCAVVGKSGTVYTGCNVENAVYPAGICAERSAISSAVTAGEKSFKEIFLITDSEKPSSPCGMCLQVMAEFCSPDIDITSASKGQAKVQKFKLKELLPHAFTKASLK